MAYYDKTTKKIYGCKKNTLVWWHEMGHKYLDEKAYDTFFEFISEGAFSLCVFFLCVPEFRHLAFYIFLIYFIFKNLEELTAWVYAFKHYKKPIKNK